MRLSSCSWSRWAAAAFGLATLLAGWALAGPLWAGEARLVDGVGPGRVVVEASDATTDEILAVLAKHFGFAVERSASANQPVRISGRLQGSLDEVLARLLRHEGHMIVRSAEAPAGIGRVLILQGRAGVPAAGAPTAAPGSAPAPALPNPIAALKARLQAREQEAEK
jgi:hypothetical protein